MNKTPINDIEMTESFAKWLLALKDKIGAAAIKARIKRAENGNFGDHKLLPDTGGVYEMRIDKGKGYRVYYGQIGQYLYLLTNGGDKSSQQVDIEKAKIILAHLKEQKK
ncbi:hypothetical protein A4G20_00320 [Pasteurellaceae bacterium RH1A]|nr:hypothetical protein A4G20_00320 [Pasteurellaceae bacterium RH1A]